MIEPEGERRPARWSERARRALDALALAFALAWGASGLLGARSWPLPIVLHAWSLAGPLFALGAGLALAQRRAPFWLHLALLAGWSVQHGPRLVRSPAAPAAGGLAFVTLNAGNGRAAPEELARWALAQQADALFLQELDAGQAAALERECAAAYPFRALHGLGIRGLGVLSRWPLGATRIVELPDGSLALLGSVALAGRALAFADVHLSAWVAVLGPWGAADESLTRVLAELDVELDGELDEVHSALVRGGAPRDAVPALLAGDFNSTSESPLLAPLRAAGFVDAFDVAGSGLGFSFPEFLRYRGLPLPPLVRIDHVFVRGLAPRSARAGSGAGADHRSLRVEVGREEP